MNLSNVTSAVCNTLITNSGVINNPSYLYIVDYPSSAAQNVQTSGYIQEVNENGEPTWSSGSTWTITTTEALPSTGVLIPDTNTFGTLGAAGEPNWYTTPFVAPSSGSIIPSINPNPFGYPYPWPGITPPDLDSLEEGIHDIKGGKIIIKKIMVTEDALDIALAEALGHDPSAEERSELREELELLSASEERDI